MRYLVNGGCGFLGSNMAAYLLEQGHEVIVFDNLFRLGSEKNLDWLEEFSGNFTFVKGDVRNYYEVEPVVQKFQPNVVFHFAGQVAMTTSIDNPYMDFEINVKGTINVLEAVRKNSPTSIVCFSSTNKVYGDLEEIDYQETESRYIPAGYPNGFDERLPLNFHSPYGCSKGAADQYMLDYARIYGIKTIVFRHSSIFGGRQFASKDQGWVGWFCQKAYEIKHGLENEPYTISGTGKQVRDILFSSDLINCYLKAIDKIDTTSGQVYNIGGGMENSYSLLELFHELESMLNIKMDYVQLPWRESDQKVFVADTLKAKRDFGWTPQINKVEGLKRMYQWVEEINKKDI